MDGFLLCENQYACEGSKLSGAMAENYIHATLLCPPKYVDIVTKDEPSGFRLPEFHS